MTRHSSSAGAIASLGFCLLALISPASPLIADPVEVAVVLSQDTAIYAEVAKGMATLLREEGHDQISLDVTSLADPPDRPVSNVELRIPVGARATRAVLSQGGGSPVLSVLIPKSTFEELRRRSAGAHNALSAVYLDQPAERQLALGKALLPDAKRIGVLIGDSQGSLKEALGDSARRNGARLLAEVIGAEANPVGAIKRLTRQADLIIAVSSPAVLTPTTAKRLLYMAYQRRVPVLGFSRALVDAGAMAAVYSTPQQIGRQTAERILAWLRSRRSALGAPEFPRYFNVAVNKAVARSLGFKSLDTEALTESLKGSSR